MKKYRPKKKKLGRKRRSKKLFEDSLSVAKNRRRILTQEAITGTAITMRIEEIGRAEAETMMENQDQRDALIVKNRVINLLNAQIGTKMDIESNGNREGQ